VLVKPTPVNPTRLLSCRTCSGHTHTTPQSTSPLKTQQHQHHQQRARLGSRHCLNSGVRVHTTVAAGHEPGRVTRVTGGASVNPTQLLSCRSCGGHTHNTPQPIWALKTKQHHHHQQEAYLGSRHCLDCGVCVPTTVAARHEPGGVTSGTAVTPDAHPAPVLQDLWWPHARHSPHPIEDTAAPAPPAEGRTRQQALPGLWRTCANHTCCRA
jgi:hypothetical protein